MAISFYPEKRRLYALVACHQCSFVPTSNATAVRRCCAVASKPSSQRCVMMHRQHARIMGIKVYRYDESYISAQVCEQTERHRTSGYCQRIASHDAH